MQHAVKCPAPHTCGVGFHVPGSRAAATCPGVSRTSPAEAGTLPEPTSSETLSLTSHPRFDVRTSAEYPVRWAMVPQSGPVIRSLGPGTRLLTSQRRLSRARVADSSARLSTEEGAARAMREGHVQVVEVNGRFWVVRGHHDLYAALELDANVRYSLLLNGVGEPVQTPRYRRSP